MIVNRLSKQSNFGNNAYVYDIANRLISVNGTTYTWDANGNLLSDGVNTYTYDTANRLISITAGASTTSYAYNGTGDRLRQITGAITTNYTLDLNSGLTQVLADGTNTYLYGNGRLGEQQPTGFVYHLPDALGSVRQLSTSAGAPALSQTFKPFGERMTSGGSGASNYGFTGEWQQGGLVHLRARYYAPTQGRFLARDPWSGDNQRPMSYNAWLYVYSSPANLVDPTGHKGVMSWDIYRSTVRNQYRGFGDNVDIAALKIGTFEVNAILRNFQGNPARDSVEARRGRKPSQPADIFCFDNDDPAVSKHARNKAERPNQPHKDLNRYDWLFSGWVDYWAWRARLAGREAVLTDPNILKAIAWTESGIGNLPARYDDPSDVEHRQSLMNQTGPSGAYELISRTPNLPSIDEVTFRRHDMTWGLMDISRFGTKYASDYYQRMRFNPQLEIGITTRYLHARYYFAKTRIAELKSASSTMIWKWVLQDYGPKPGDAQFVGCYGEMIWAIATTGTHYRSCTPNKLSPDLNFDGPITDLWGRYR